jgi:hypothetical protein
VWPEPKSREGAVELILLLNRPLLPAGRVLLTNCHTG